VKAGKLPACVTVCPNKARLFGDLNDPESEVSEIFAEDPWMVLKPHMHTDPNGIIFRRPNDRRTMTLPGRQCRGPEKRSWPGRGRWW
jgi:Fe-S-cluster-containing dehydrogenase component